MKKLVYAALAAAMTIGAVSPAAAWTHGHCRAADGSAVSNKTIAKECHAWIVGEGVISKGDHKGSLWKDAYPGINYKAIDSDGVVVQTHKLYFAGSKFVYHVDGKQTVRTKEIGSDDMGKYMEKFGVSKVDVTRYYNCSRIGKYQYELTKNPKHHSKAYNDSRAYCNGYEQHDKAFHVTKKKGGVS